MIFHKSVEYHMPFIRNHLVHLQLVKLMQIYEASVRHDATRCNGMWTDLGVELESAVGSEHHDGWWTEGVF